MNNEALDMVYNLAVKDGYRQSKANFAKLLASDYEALEMSYEMAKKGGYHDAIEDFSVLIGNEKLPEKKNTEITVTESAFEDGSSASSEDKSVLENVTNLVNPQQSAGTITEQQVSELQEMYDNPDLYNQKAQELATSLQQQGAGPQEPKDSDGDGEAGTEKDVFIDNLTEMYEDEDNREEYEENKKTAQDLENTQKKNAYNDLLFNNIDFQENIVTIDDKLTSQKESDLVDYLTEKFGQYGFVFEPTGGDQVIVRTVDGLNEIYIESGEKSSPEVSDKLRQFIVKYSMTPENRENTIVVEDFVTQSIKAQNSRSIGRQNNDGSVSTHLMSYAEEDGRFVAFPTLFPNNPDVHSAWPDRWTEFDDDEWQSALLEAKERGEVYYFDTEEEAEAFANGAWKHVDSPEIVAQEFYKENGLDYFAEQEMYENYVDTHDDIAFLEEQLSFQHPFDNLTEAEQEKYAEYYNSKGELQIDVAEADLVNLENQRDELQDVVMTTEREDLRDALDLKLHRLSQVKVEKAVQINETAKVFMDELEVVSLQQFGVPLADLSTIVAANEQEAELIYNLQAQADVGRYTEKFAAYKYELAKTFFSRKNDKQIMAEYVTGMKAFRESIRNGWFRGRAGNILIQIQLGIKDGNDKEVQEKLARFLSEPRAEQSKFLYRYMRAREGEGSQYVLGESGINVPRALVNGISLASESLSQMLPYGWWIVPTTTLVGTGIGAGLGSVGFLSGPGGTLTTGAGALLGAGKGFHTGMGIAGFVLEYTNSLMDAMREAGYDLTNPDDVALALNDKEVWAEGRNTGLKRGIPIGIVDAFTSGMAGRVFKVGSVMSKTRKVGTQVAERMLFDPLGEMAGEGLAQVVAGQEIDAKEIFLEGWGGMGNNTSGMAVNLLVDQVNFSNTKLANSFVDFNFLAKESSSNERVVQWANNMRNLGKISAEQEQEILTNVGFKREATEILGKSASPTTIARTMELLSARADLSRTNNLKQINSKLIGDINAELAEIAKTGKVVKDGIEVSGAIDTRSKASKQSSYTIDGKKLSRENFLKKLNKLTNEQLTEADIVVNNDSEVETILKDKNDAIQKSKTEKMDVGEQTTDGSEVGAGGETIETTSAGEEADVTEQADAPELGEESPLQSDRKMTGGRDTRQRDGEETPFELNPIKANKQDKIKYANGTLDENRKRGILVEIANKTRAGKKLTPFQVQVANENQESLAQIDDEIQGVIDLEQSLKEDKGPKVDFKSEDNYRGTHTAPRPEEGYNNRADNPVDIYGEDIYGPNGERYFGERRSYDGKTINIIQEMRGKPEKEITIYRAVPKGVKKINPGDWVTLSKEYAVEHGKHADDASKDMDVISMKVKVKDLYTAGESIHEWGYNPQIKKQGKKKTKVDFKSEPSNQGSRLNQKNTPKGILQSFNDLMAQIGEAVKNTPQRVSGMFFTPTILNNKPIFNLDKKLIEKIKNGEVEVSYEVVDGSKLTKDERKQFQVGQFDARVFLHADGQIVGRMDLVAGLQEDLNKQRNGTVLTVEVHPELRGLGLGQQMYEAANEWSQSNYQQPLKSDDRVTSETAEMAWSALEDKGKVTRVKDDKSSKYPSAMSDVMKETQFTFKDEKILLDAVNKWHKKKGLFRFNTYEQIGDLSQSELLKIISDLVTEGDPVNNNTQLLNFMSKAFPSVNISASQQAFDNVMSREDVIQYKRGGDTIYGVTVDGDIWINPEVHKDESQLFNTSIHEFGHIWTNYLQTTEKGRQIWQKGAELVQQTKLYERQLAKFDGDVFKATNETMAILIGNKGEQIADASLLSKFKNWLEGMWTYIKSQFKMSKDLTTDEIQNLTLDKFLGTALSDIFSGKEIKLTDKQLTQLKNPEVMFSSTDSMVDIINKGRQQGIADASIKNVLKGRGFKVSEINDAMRVEVQDNVTLPAAFTNIDGGAIDGFRLFNDIRNKLNKFAYTSEKGKRKGTRVKTYAEVRAEAQRLLKESPVFQKQTQDKQMAMQVDLDKSLDIRTNPTTQKEISAIRNTIKAKKLAVRDIKALQNQLRGLIRKLLPKSSTYSQAKINSLLKRITDLTQDNYVQKTEEVLNIIDKQKGQIKNELIKKIISLVKKKAASNITKGKRRVTKGLDAIGQDFFRAVKDVLKIATIKDIDERNYKIEQLKKEISAENILAQLGITETELINKALSNPESLTPAEQRMLHKLQAYDTVGDLMTATMEEVEAKLKILEDSRSESIGRLQIKRLERAMRAEKLSDQATQQIEETYPELFDTDKDGNKIPKDKNAIYQMQNSNQLINLWKKSGLVKGAKQLLKNLKLDKIVGIRTFFKEKLLHLHSLTELLDRSGKGKKFFQNNIWKPLRKMDRGQKKGMAEVFSRLDDMANSIPGITKGYKEIRQKLYIGKQRVILNGVEHEFSGDQLLRIYTLSKNEVQKNKLEKQGFTPEVMADIEKRLPKQTMEFADKTVEFLSNEYFESINEVYKQANDTSLGYVENYFPTRTISRDTSKELLAEGNFGAVFSDNTHSALKERTDVGGKVDLGSDFTSTLGNHIDSMEHYKSYAVGVKDLTAVINTPAVQTLLDASGLGYALKRAINFAINPQSLNNNKAGVMEKLQSKFTSWALAFKLMQIPKQASSFINAFEDYNRFTKRATGKESSMDRLKNIALQPLELISFMADFGYVMATLPRQFQKAREMSPVFADRVDKGLEGDLHGLVSGNLTQKEWSKNESQWGERLRTIRKWMSAPTVIGDVMGIMGYMANYNRNLREGMSHEDAVKAFEEYELTQQTRAGTEKVPLQMTNDVLTRSFTMFGSTLFLQLNKVYIGFTKIMRAVMEDGKVPDAASLKAVVLNAGVANVLFTMMANSMKLLKGGEDDREEVLEQMKRSMLGMNILAQIPLAGSALEWSILKMMGENPRQQDIVNPLTRVFSDMFKFYNDKNLTGFQKTKQIAVSILELGVGFQVDPFLSPLEDLADGKLDENTFYDIIGVSKSYRPNASKQKLKEKKKSRGKKKNTDTKEKGKGKGFRKKKKYQ